MRARHRKLGSAAGHSALGTALLLAGLVLLPFHTSAQTRPLISSEIGVSSRGTTLSLEFAEGSPLVVEFSEGIVSIDGESVGTYQRGDALESSWRELLGRATQLDDGPLAEALLSWDPPSGVEGDPATVALRLDRAIETALERDVSEPTSDVQVEATGDLDVDLLTSLLGRTERFIALSEALEEVDLELDDLDSERVRVHLNEEVLIGRDETVDATLILIDSDLDVRGRLAGSAILVGGRMNVGEEARIDGQVHLADARISRDGGVVGGGINRIRLEREIVDAEVISELRDEIRDEIRREIRHSIPRDERDDGVFAAFRHVARGIGGMLQNLMTFAIVAVLAFGVVRYYGTNLDVVAEAARQSPMRAGVVGVAGAFLLLPVWILGIVGLCISLIGIPVLLAWIPLFPLAALLAAGLGFLAVASNVGDWVSRQELQGFDWVRRSNTLSIVLAGVAVLILPFFAANFIQMAGDWLGFVRHLLHFIGGVGILVSMAVGFGAVLLTRGGRRRDWAYSEADLDPDPATWESSYATTTEDQPDMRAESDRPTRPEAGRGAGTEPSDEAGPGGGEDDDQTDPSDEDDEEGKPDA